MGHRGLLALSSTAMGGWPWLVWGVPVRVAVSLHGHWLVGHLIHRLALRRLGLVSDLREPRHLAARPGLRRLERL